jgi:hypothetical protein
MRLIGVIRKFTGGADDTGAGTPVIFSAQAGV